MSYPRSRAAVAREAEEAQRQIEDARRRAPRAWTLLDRISALRWSPDWIGVLTLQDDMELEGYQFALSGSAHRGQEISEESAAPVAAALDRIEAVLRARRAV